MKEVFAIDFRPNGGWEAISLKKQAGRYLVSPAGSFQEASSEAETFIRQNAGRIIALFPFEETYFHEIRISKKIPQVSLPRILKASTEAALPIHLNGQFHFDLSLGASENEERRLQLITTLPENAFRPFYELEMIELQPTAFFEGFSRLFTFPDHQKCFLYYQAAQYELFVIGQGGKIQKMRIIKKKNAYQFWEIVADFLKGEEVNALYSWCGEEGEKTLSALPFSTNEKQSIPQGLQKPVKTCVPPSKSSHFQWTHLKSSRIPLEIQSYKDKIEWICHAIAFLEGFINSCSRISPSRFSFVQGNLANMWSRMLGILIILMGAILLYACLQLRIQQHREYFLYENISKKFYSFFSPQTPLINPVQQLSELFQANDPGNDSLGNTPDSGIFLQSLSAFFKNKPIDQTVTRITQDRNRVFIEGLYQNRDKLNEWLSPLNGMGFSGLKIHIVKVEWPTDKHYRLIFEYEKGDL